jgi:hypothetical protein
LGCHVGDYANTQCCCQFPSTDRPKSQCNVPRQNVLTCQPKKTWVKLQVLTQAQSQNLGGKS